MSAAVPVECGAVGCNVYRLFHPTLKPPTLTVEDADVVCLETVTVGQEKIPFCVLTLVCGGSFLFLLHSSHRSPGSRSYK